LSPIYGLNPSSIWHCVGNILSQKINERIKHVKWSNGAKLEDIVDALVIWIGQVNVKNVTATDEVIKEEAKVIGQQMCVTQFVHKNWYVFCSKNEIIVKMSTYKMVLL
jgi:hypothetical protein